MKYFVILRTQTGGAVPMVNDQGNLALYLSQSAAADAADENPLGHACGYIIYPWHMKT